jgi:hypothetical protein
VLGAKEVRLLDEALMTSPIAHAQLRAHAANSAEAV